MCAFVCVCGRGIPAQESAVVPDIAGGRKKHRNAEDLPCAMDVHRKQVSGKERKGRKKKIMKKRVLTVIAAALLSGAMVAGCGGSTSSSAASSSASAASGSVSAEASSAETSSAEKTEAVLSSSTEQAGDASVSSASAGSAEIVSGSSVSSTSAEAGTTLADGTYEAKFNTDSSMFYVNEMDDGKGILTVKDGKMTIHIRLLSQNIVNLFYGNKEDAQKEGAELLEPTVETVDYGDGTTEDVNCFDVPVPAIGEDYTVSLIGTHGNWYEHTVSVTDPVPVSQ